MPSPATPGTPRPAAPSAPPPAPSPGPAAPSSPPDPPLSALPPPAPRRSQPWPPAKPGSDPGLPGGIGPAALALLLAHAALLAALAPHRHWDPDEFQHAQAAWLIGQGLIPFVDFFEHHTPLWHLLAAPFAALVDPTSLDSALRFLVGARLAGLALSAALVAATWGLARHLAGPAAATLAALFLAAEAHFLLKAVEIRPDQLAALATIVATYALARAAGAHHAARWAFAAGLAFGIALLASQKPICAAPGLALGLLLLTGRRFPRLAAAATAGALVAALPVLAWFAAHGALSALFEHTIAVNLRWTRNFDHRVWDHAARILRQDTLLAALAAAGAALLLARAPRTPLACLTLPPLATLAIGAFALPVIQEQYVVLAAPYAAILAGWAAVHLAARSPRRAVLALAALLLLATAARNTQIAFHRTDADTRARLAWLLANTAPDSTVMGGWTPGLAFRRPALFHFVLHEEIQAAIPPETWHALARDIAAGTLAPAVIDLDPALMRLPPELLGAISARYTSGGMGTFLVPR